MAALAAYRLVPAATPGMAPEPWRLHRLYIPAAAFGAIVGAYLIGSANLWLTGIPGVARNARALAELGLPGEVLRGVLGGNAAKLFPGLGI